MNMRPASGHWAGYWIVVLTITAGAAVLVWYHGAALHPSPLVRVLIVLLIGALLLSARGLLTGAWHWAARHAPHRDGGHYTRDASPSATDSHWRDALAIALRERHGWRWRYRQPWLLLTSNDKTIARLLPELVEQGYLVAEDFVLLWHDGIASGTNDRWLQTLYRLRRRRAIDGLVLVIDGVEDRFVRGHAMPVSGARLAGIARTLRCSAPVYVLDAAQVDRAHDGTTPPSGYEIEAGSDAPAMQANLLALRDRLARLGVQRLGDDLNDSYVAKLSQRLEKRAAPMSAWLADLAAHEVLVRGAYFSPFRVRAVTGTQAHATIWSHLAELTGRDRARRVGLHPLTVCAVAALILVALWTIGMIASAFANAHDLHRSVEVVQSLEQGTDAARLRALLKLQQRIDHYEDRLLRRAFDPRGFGLDRDRETLDALWAHYEAATRALLTAPVQSSLESSLGMLVAARADAVQDSTIQQQYYRQLKTYLMLGEPARGDPGFLAEQIAMAWPRVNVMSIGEWQDTSQRLAGFFAKHLKEHPQWRIESSAALIASARAALVNQIGLANADDTLYDTIIDGVRGKYADLSLPALLNGTNAQGLFTTSMSVPGIYTKAAWDGLIAEAIDKAASERQVESDWVLSGTASTASRIAAAADKATEALRGDSELKQRLSARYFAEYSAAWQQMLNSIQWQPATNLNQAIDQLMRLSDAQTSPLIALMKSVQVQAHAGRASQELGDKLVRRAQDLLGRDDPLATPTSGPLDASFGPLLALMGDDGKATAGRANRDAAALSGVSLQSYLTAATTMRLKLQQIGNTPDAQAMARALAQSVLQGKLSDLAQVREQAALTAASLGNSWAGFGNALFMRPLDGAWQTILQPAAASLNELWRGSIARPFNSAFDGRYPFYDTTADASFAELGRYVRPTSGLINGFLSGELSGALSRQGDQWIPDGLAPQTLSFDPAFLDAVRQMSILGARLYASGDAAYRFELMPEPSPNVTRSELTIDRQKIVYFNQQQSWAAITWPGDGLNGHAALTWQALDAGARQAFDATGDWAFLRMLEAASIKPLDSARYALTWHQEGAESLRYVMRTQVGAGPLDLMKLRGFKLPERIFVIPASAAGTIGQGNAPALPAQRPSP